MGVFPAHIVMVGCGNMAGAMLDRWIASGLDGACVTVVDPGRTAPPAPGVTLCAAMPDMLAPGAFVVLGVKPQMLPDIAPALAPKLTAGTIVVSMLAGVTLDILRSSLGKDADFVRVMPNTPVALGLGVCALYADDTTCDAVREGVEGLMQPLGLVEWMAQEDQFNLLTALTGCGPAYVFRFIDALARAASALGMDGEQADRLALATVQGAAALAAMPGTQSPAQLAENVASRGGMTREGLDVLDADGRLDAVMRDTLRAARDRGEVLARLAGA